MSNIKVIIQKHNKKTFNKTNKTKEQNNITNTPSCNCRSKNLCPLNNNCLIKNVIYKATITSAKEMKYYMGSTGNLFKSKWYSHNNSFKNYKDNGTELGIWNTTKSITTKNGAFSTTSGKLKAFTASARLVL